MGARCLIVTTLIIAGCASNNHIPIGMPVCFPLIPITDQIWNDLDLLREVVSHNQLVDHECIEKLRARIRLHDENS